MAPRKLRQRLVEASLAGRYDIHLGVGLAWRSSASCSSHSRFAARVPRARGRCST
jgi:hypothetical protein